MRQRSFLVTGGAGFIGSHLVDLLMNNGHTVIVLDDLSSGKIDNLRNWTDDPKFRFIRGDVTNDLTEQLNERTLRGSPSIGTIFHLAARVDVISSFESPLENADTNYLGTMRVLDFALKNDIKRVVFASSAAVYGENVRVPTSEEEETSPMSPYGLHKLASEKLMEIYRNQWGLSTLSLRFFNVYGPRQDPESQYSGVITRFIGRGLNKEPLIIFGSGEQTRDFIFVGDVVEGTMTATISGVEGILNLGTGLETSINHLSEMIGTISGNDAGVVHSSGRKGELIRSCADVSRMEAECQFKAETEMDEGLKMTAAWFRGKF
jgi:UDP-glucose 4-epimerase